MQPSGVTYQAQQGESLMGAAQSRGLYWPTTCGGQGICTTCLTEIVSGGELLAEMARSERKTLVAERGEVVLNRPVRLACQATVLSAGTITVTKLGVRSATDV